MISSFFNRINAALAVGLVVVGIVGWGGYTAIESLVVLNEHETVELEAFALINRAALKLAGAEAQQRNHLLTGSQADYNGYVAAREQLAEALHRMEALSAVPQHAAPLRPLAGAMAQRLESMDRAVEARRAFGISAAMAIDGNDRNRELAREIGELVAQADTSEQRPFEVASAEANREATVSRLTIVLGTMLSMGLLTWAILVIGRYSAQHASVEAQLRESDERSRAITENMADGVITTEEDGTIVEANAAAKALFGYPGDEMIGRNVASFVPESHRSQLEMALQHFRMRAGPIREPGRELRAVRKDGAKFYVRASFSDVRVGGKRLFVSVVRDITERICMTQQLKASETQLRQVTDAIPALIAYIDADRVVRFNNRAYEEFFGLDPSRILGCKLEDVVGGKIYDELREHVDQALAGFPASYERSHTMPSGDQRHLEGHFFPRYGDGSDEGKVMGFYSLVTDITELKRLDRMKSEFVSTVSHELRTPLTSIRGSLGLLAGGVAGPLPDAARNLIDIAKNNCERLIRLINDILDSEKIESGKMQLEIRPLALKPLLEQALAANEGFAAQHGVRLSLSSTQDEAMVQADADRLMQVVTNLVSNAVKFSPKGGAVEVDLSRRGFRIRVEVRDHGSGIPVEFRERIFQKFSQADSSDSRVKGGTGLGLNISRSIIERLGGTIGFASNDGDGTTFFFELPEGRSPPGRTNGAEAAASRRVLVCEDDPDIARLIAMMLERGGLASDVAYDAAEARRRLAAQPYDAMTVDLRLPGEDGLSLIRSLRNEPATHTIPIIVVSATAEEGRVQLNNESLSVSEWLQKPIDENRLVNGVREAIEGNAHRRLLILHVEDDPDIQHIAATLAQEFAAFEFAETVAEARALLAERRFDLVLLDLTLPDGSGLELLREIRALEPRPRVVIFSASETAVEGADEILVKSRTSNEELLRALQRALEEEPR